MVSTHFQLSLRIGDLKEESCGTDTTGNGSSRVQRSADAEAVTHQPLIKCSNLQH